MPKVDEADSTDTIGDMIEREKSSAAEEVETDEADEADVEKPEDKLISQAELDRILQKRLKRQEDALAKKYADYDTLKADAEEYHKLQGEKATDSERWEKEKAGIVSERDDLKSELSKLQRANLIADLATDAALPKSFWKRVSGDSREEIEEDIADIVKDLGITKDSKETTPSTTKTSASKQKGSVYGGGGEIENPDPDVDKIVAGIPRGPQIRVDKPRTYK